MNNWVSELDGVVERLMPRLLTQACRDPNSPTYGCFDRDWWHYRIRDFASIILQQGGYTVWLADKRNGDLAAASCRFWNARAVRHGAFEEYYPFERGYPPLAFSTLSVMKMAAAGVVSPSDIEAGARVAAKQLLSRFEPHAANQQVAGLAALAWLKRVYPALVPADALAEISQKTLALQTTEGWYMEYGGPDLGYLSVTLDCLWDCLDATGDVRYRESAAAGLRCIGRYVQALGGGIGMHNARNTDYILPYGIARFIKDGGADGELASGVLSILYGNVGQADHFLRAMDDRYLSHYMGHSLVRALLLMKDGQGGVVEDEVTTKRGPPTGAVVDTILELSGHVLLAGGERKYSAIMSLKKGGVITMVGANGRVSDFGWVVKDGESQQVNHWWSDAWRWTRDGDRFVVSGRMVKDKEHESAPIKHVVLRVLSWIFGRRLIGPLKNLLIFKKGAEGFPFERVVTLGRDTVVVEDRITGVSDGVKVIQAPRSSKRHVASADSFHSEDLALGHEVRRDVTTILANGVFRTKTVYTVT
jgi:hypothetical protein